MKEVWYKADEGDWEDRLPLITAAIESGVDYVLVDGDEVGKVRELGEVGVAAFVSENDVGGTGGGDGKPDVAVVGKGGEGDGTVEFPPDMSGSSDLTTVRRIEDNETGSYVEIDGKGYERLAAEAGGYADYVVVVGEDWRIIPLENLIADLQDEDARIVAGVGSAEEAKTAFETMETGADGVLLDTDDPGEIKETVRERDRFESEELELVDATVTAVEPTEMGDRVCVDTATLMEHGEGMLVGSMSSGLFLVHAEVAESPYVASRPFRVNAGAVHAYIRVPGGGTKYLSELEAGDEVLVVNEDGETREALVGRSKIEKRPMFLVEAEYEGERYRTLLQNAETIRLVTPDGTVSVTELEEGDEVRLYVEEGGRHFGTKVEESVVEK
ncbi:3-dehydroquinate synthase II [Haladaptatus sp. F3-133]|uniref:3-dehydroquinate synthase n=1 Tax=Halorutilus salinus TaxID=2487751 RepID=A0A9Q4GIH4_9EURY|nr:3-dehydroquinate synthase II [Halorutilus salinus]MCX2819875.1 3-dehydroquinate synthase II [Halorutilus salinus]